MLLIYLPLIWILIFLLLWDVHLEARFRLVKAFLDGQFDFPLLFLCVGQNDLLWIYWCLVWRIDVDRYRCSVDFWHILIRLRVIARLSTFVFVRAKIRVIHSVISISQCSDSIKLI